MNTRFVEVDGRRLRVGESRRGNGRPLLLFNGFGVPMEMLDGFASALERTHVLTFDMPGIGGSSPPLLPYRFPGIARLSARLLDRLGYQEVDVMGISWGGGAAQQFARDFPGRCIHLILAATSPGMLMVPGKPWVALKMASPGTFNNPVRMGRFLSQIQGRSTPNDKALHSLPPLETNLHDLRGHIYQFLALWGWTSFHWLHRIRQPVLVLSGEGDPLAPPINGKILACRIPNATARTFPGGHLFPVLSRDLVANMVEGFLREEGEFASRQG